MEFEFMEVFYFLFFQVFAILIVFTIFFAVFKKLGVAEEIPHTPKKWAIYTSKFFNFLGLIIFLPLFIMFIGYIFGDIEWQEFAYRSFFEVLPSIIWFMVVRSFVFITLGTDGTEAIAEGVD